MKAKVRNATTKPKAPGLGTTGSNMKGSGNGASGNMRGHGVGVSGNMRSRGGNGATRPT